MAVAMLTVPLTGDVAPDFKAAVMTWQVALRGAHKSPATIRAYRMAALQFAAFLADHGMPTAPANISAEHVREYLGQPQARATARLRHAALRLFFRHLVEEGEIRKSPMDTVRPPKLAEDDAIRTFLSDADFAKMVATCRKRKPPTFADRRDLAILLVLRTGGLRRAECAALTPADVDTEQGLVVVRHGKG
jgi:site-specific recombinase XerD